MLGEDSDLGQLEERSCGLSFPDIIRKSKAGSPGEQQKPGLVMHSGL